ncbi:phage late control D family protein [Paenibacillus hamazuiensis]|uniref:phage late control D family protein n=1 Tax=Paenibacillus hamazuiensis TaxID=2936508 RepID=UPI00200F5618|nr:contractile injection system protein, VgrG/Pvc8 family [Paenibacillus hamazuiensis]
MAEPTLSTQTFTFEELEKKYGGFFAPTFEVLINGTNIALTAAITQVTVETSIESEASSFEFTVVNAFDPLKQEFQWLDSEFTLGTYVEIRMGYVDKLETVLYGLITSVSCEFPSDDLPKIIVRGMDMSFLMMRSVRSQSWEKKKISDIVSEVGKQYVSKVVADDTGDPIEITAQNECSDYEFISELAKELNYDFFIVGKTMYFRKALESTSPVVTLAWGKTLRSFAPEMNIAAQVGKVVVRGWDVKKTALLEGTSGQVKKLGSNSKTGPDILNSLGSYTEYVYTNVDTEQEAKDKATAILNYRAMQLISGYGECDGIPEMMAGLYVKMEGLGKKLSQPYYLKAVTHTIDSFGYVTRFRIGGNAV